MTHKTKKHKAVGLISGGLDSLVSVMVVKKQDIEVHGLYFFMPWMIIDNQYIKVLSDQLGIKILPLQLNDEFYDIVKYPRFGHGTAMNPCIDCKIFMLAKAREHMNKIKADFVFTGEVLGQRPMSQNKRAMNIIEDRSGLKGYLVRPLSAKFLEPTIPELEKTIDREALLDISGRGRSSQIKLAEKFGINDYKQPAGGCLLTDKNYSNKLKDKFTHDYKDFKDTINLNWGRHFRINKKFKAILGRDKRENELLVKHAKKDDHIMHLDEKNGPYLLLEGIDPKKDILSASSSLVLNFSKYKDQPGLKVRCWKVSSPDDVKFILADPLITLNIDKIKI